MRVRVDQARDRRRPARVELRLVAGEADADLGEAPIADAHVDAVEQRARTVEQAEVADQHGRLPVPRDRLLA